LIIGGLVLFSVLCLMGWVGLTAANTLVPLDQQTVMLQRLALSAAMAGTVGAILTLAGRWGRHVILPGLALGVFAVLGAGYVRTSLQVNYDHPDTPSEPLIYVQTSPDVPWVVSEIERIGKETGQGKNVGILMDNGWNDGVHESVAWPFEWYLRDYKNKRYYSKTIDSSINLADYPVLLAMGPNMDPIREQLQQYSGQKYYLNWWFPEDYKEYAGSVKLGPISLPTLKVGAIADTLSNPQNRVKLLQFLLFRQAPNEMSGREFYFEVNNSIPRFGPAGPTGAAPATVGAPRPAAQPSPSNLVAQPGPDGSTILGRSADGVAGLIDPKNAAQAPDGRVYVVEGKANRVTVLNPDGSVQRTFGSSGQGDGQFNEPWGIAIGPDGDVYVADTWNHRIQRFTADGQFVARFGRLGEATSGPAQDGGVFWGPRALAIGPDGELFVTDTGNKRVEVFDLDGHFKRAFGGEGSNPGQFREPVGISVDADGTLWVADAWNNRVQHLDKNGAPLGAFPVSSDWLNQSITNKPYLSSGPGGLALTVPDAGQLVIYQPDGTQVKQLQIPQGGSAVGVSWTPDGRILVADARSGTILVYPGP
jgi:DNA-binding beta-propeller fold protein YncE